MYIRGVACVKIIVVVVVVVVVRPPPSLKTVAALETFPKSDVTRHPAEAYCVVVE